MYKIILALFLGTVLNAELVNGVAIIVKGEAITLYDIKEEMKNSNVSAKDASTILIRKKLEEVEIKDRKIKVSSAEVYESVKQAAAKNNMNVSDFYEAVRSSKGLSSTEFKEITRENLLSQKLYSSIAYTSVSQPSDEEVQEYFDLHRKEFEHASKFIVTVYSAKDKADLQNKINNPMFFSANIHSVEKKLEYDKINPDLAAFLNQTDVNSFSPIIPDGQGNQMSFFIQEKVGVEKVDIESVKDDISNRLMGDKREQVLSDYFARLRGNSEIKTIRMPE